MSPEFSLIELRDTIPFILSETVIEYGLFWNEGMTCNNVALFCQGNVKGN